MTGLKITRNDSETWIDAALRRAKKYGLENEVQEAYHQYIASGDSEEDAAFAACYDWDICDLYISDK